MAGIVRNQRHDIDEGLRNPKTKMVESVMPDPGPPGPKDCNEWYAGPRARQAGMDIFFALE